MRPAVRTRHLDGQANHGAPNALRVPLDEQARALDGAWGEIVTTFLSSPAGQCLSHKLNACLAAGRTVYPARVFRALELTPLEQVRVVILGQDPYHGPGQAHGLAFSVPDGIAPLPPSLRNIFKELQRDLGHAPASGNLEAWARQGVLLLNTTLTVEDASPASHAHWPWAELTDALILAAAREAAPKIFMLWGAHAQRKHNLIAASNCAHSVLMANHPSPLSARRPPKPFIGCGHFGAAQRFGDTHGWRIGWS